MTTANDPMDSDEATQLEEIALASPRTKARQLAYFKRLKRTRPPLLRSHTSLSGRRLEHTFCSHCQDNIRQFFKYHSERLVRKELDVSELEKKKAETFVFFLALLQFSLCVAYGSLVRLLPNKFIFATIAVLLCIYFVSKMIAIVIFSLRMCHFQRGTKLNFEDPEKDGSKSILICVPVYNEGKSSFERMLASIVKSNYPKQKLYVMFIVDGNKSNSFQRLMSVLNNKEFEVSLKANQRILVDGIYENVGYSVFLKEENRGKRDSQWLFVEIIRNMMPEFKPNYVLFVDSDTAFESNAILNLSIILDQDELETVAGVCGKLQLSNPPFGSCTVDWRNVIFYLSTLVIVGYQHYEYHFNQIIGKKAEAAFGSVTCLPGAFSMFRSKYLEELETEMVPNHTPLRMTSQELNVMSPRSFCYLENKARRPLTLSDFFSKPTKGIIERNLYQLGEDRTLTIRFLERALYCLYEPHAIAFTECPDTLRKLMQQRRRWNNSTFVNLLLMLSRSKMWSQCRLFPVMFFSIFDLLGSYLLPANALLIISSIWSPVVDIISSIFQFDISGGQVVFWWALIAFIVTACTKVDSSYFFYMTHTLFAGIMMALSSYWLIRVNIMGIVGLFIENPESYWPELVVSMIFPSLHLAVSLPQPYMFLTVVFYYLMLPTIAVTIPIYATLNLDDFTWGNR